MVELILYAGIAAIIIGKFISILGITEEDDRQSVTKNVTNTGANHLSEDVSVDEMDGPIVGLISDNAPDEVIENLYRVKRKIPDFDPRSFCRISKRVATLLIETSSYGHVDTHTVDDLVDKRYKTAFIEHSKNSYSRVDVADLDSVIANVQFFGNNILITMLFSNKNFREEWTFSKNIVMNSQLQTNVWVVSNIETV